MKGLNPITIASDRGLPLEAHRVLRCLENILSFDRYLTIDIRSIAEILNIHPQAVSRALRILIDRQVITRGERVGRASTYRFSRDAAKLCIGDLTVIIRGALEADLDELVRAGQFTPDYGRDDLKRDIAGRRCWLAMANDVIVGQLAIRKDSSIEMSYLLARVLVDRAYRGRGIGRRLIAAMERSLDGNRIHAYCALSDAELVRFLANSGFSLSGYVKELRESDTRLFFGKIARPSKDE